MRTVNILEAKNSLSELVRAVESGAEDEVIIARNGKPAVRLAKIERKVPKIGGWEGVYVAPDDFDALNPEIEKMFYGEFSAEDEKTDDAA